MKTRLTKTSLLTLTLPVLLFVTAGHASGQAIDPTAWYQITAEHSGKCLAVAGGALSLADGDGVIQWECIASEENQKWEIIPVGDGLYRITARHSRKSLDVRGGVGALGDGVPVQQWDYIGNTNQKWMVIPIGNASYQIIAVHSGKSLDVSGGIGATWNGPYVQQSENLGAANQRWRLTDTRPRRSMPTATISLPPTRGRFRVTLTGFVVNTATVDGLLTGDGLGDEVYAAAEVAELSSLGNVVAPRSPVSLTYGDTSADHSLPGRIRAGDIPPTGGLQAGNRYPKLGEPLPMPISESTRERLIPMILWEGELRGGQNQNAVVILPTIWESDNDLVMLGHWQLQTRNSLRVFARRSGSWVLGRAAMPLITPADFLTEPVNRNDFDRPLGIQGDAFVPLAVGTATFTPFRMFLTLNSAQTAAVSTTNSTTQGRGVVEITYRDGPRYGPGNYTIFLLVERLPDR